MNLVIHTDGGARGNPGPSAIGVVIELCTCLDPRACTESKRKRVVGFGKKIGETTNNVAEYTAVIEALQYMRDSMSGESVSKIAFYLDSTLVVNQLNGLYKVKESHLRDLVTRVHFLEPEVGSEISYTAVPREQNRAADLLVNQALDS